MINRIWGHAYRSEFRATADRPSKPRVSTWAAVFALTAAILLPDEVLAGEMECGGARIKLACRTTASGRDAGSCEKSVLEFRSGTGDKAKRKVITSAWPDPRHANKVPVEASCLTNASLEFFVLVQFAAGPIDCVPCSVTDLFTPDGSRITTLGRHLDREMANRQLLKSITGAPRIRFDR